MKINASQNPNWSGERTRLACRLGRLARAIRTVLGETPAARETRALPGPKADISFRVFRTPVHFSSSVSIRVSNLTGVFMRFIFQP
jgi:hypothetical protein